MKLSLAECDMHATKELYTKHERKGVLYQLRNFAEDYSKQDNRIEYAVKSLPAWLTYGQKTGRGILDSLAEELSKVKPDRRVEETFSTLVLLNAMRLVCVSGHIVSHDIFRSSVAGVEAVSKRMNAMRKPQGLFNMQSDPQKYLHLGSLLREFCECPWPKNRNTPTWLDRMTEARRLLAKF